jgi:hypothetical protein
VTDTWKDEPIVEILRDGDHWKSPWDSRFRFGRVKAKLILSSKRIIEKFALSDDPAAVLPERMVRRPDKDLAIQLQTFPAFTNSYGVYVEEPFLRIERIERGFPPPHIGLGLAKAAAVTILRPEIHAWLRNVGGWWRP